jgi:hypothetical protein
MEWRNRMFAQLIGLSGSCIITHWSSIHLDSKKVVFIGKVIFREI